MRLAVLTYNYGSIILSRASLYSLKKYITAAQNHLEIENILGCKNIVEQINFPLKKKSPRVGCIFNFKCKSYFSFSYSQIQITFPLHFRLFIGFVFSSKLRFQFIPFNQYYALCWRFFNSYSLTLKKSREIYFRWFYFCPRPSAFVLFRAYKQGSFKV